jgi:hypothetical protein
MKPNEKTGKEELGEYEVCILCGKVTVYKKDTHIDFRNWYIEGAGQCCESCYVKAYGCN